MPPTPRIDPWRVEEKKVDLQVLLLELIKALEKSSPATPVSFRTKFEVQGMVYTIHLIAAAAPRILEPILPSSVSLMIYDSAENILYASHTGFRNLARHDEEDIETENVVPAWMEFEDEKKLPEGKQFASILASIKQSFREAVARDATINRRYQKAGLLQTAAEKFYQPAVSAFVHAYIAHRVEYPQDLPIAAAVAARERVQIFLAQGSSFPPDYLTYVLETVLRLEEARPLKSDLCLLKLYQNEAKLPTLSAAWESIAKDLSGSREDRQAQAWSILSGEKREAQRQAVKELYKNCVY